MAVDAAVTWRTSGTPRLIPVVLALLVWFVPLNSFLWWLTRAWGLGTEGPVLLEDASLVVLAVAIVAWARWWRQTGLVGPWRQPWWALAAAALLAEQLLLTQARLPVPRAPVLLAAVLLDAVLIGLGEELLCRGVLLYGLGRYGVLVAGLVSSAVFGLGHISPLSGWPPSYQVVNAIIAAQGGLLFAGLRLRMNSLWPLVVTHGAFDVPALLAGSTFHPAPIGLFAALISTGLFLPAAMVGLGLLLWDHLNGTDRWADT